MGRGAYPPQAPDTVRQAAVWLSDDPERPGLDSAPAVCRSVSAAPCRPLLNQRQTQVFAGKSVHIRQPAGRLWCPAPLPYHPSPRRYSRVYPGPRHSVKDAVIGLVSRRHDVPFRFEALPMSAVPLATSSIGWKPTAVLQRTLYDAVLRRHTTNHTDTLGTLLRKF
jgi:hypothetical protein